MKERMLERLKFKAELKERLVHMVMYQGAEVKDLVPITAGNPHLTWRVHFPLQNM